MPQHPEMTFRGALRILGKHEPAGIGRLDKALGGGILLAGAAAVLAPPLTPLAMIAPLWAWVDQKNEAVGLLKGLTSGLSARIRGLGGMERRELVAAAHSTIAAAAFFEVFEESVGKKTRKALRITDADRARLVAGETVVAAFRWLYSTEIPMPSATAGFVENQPELLAWYHRLTDRTIGFLTGLEAWQVGPGTLGGQWLTKVMKRYESRYVELAAQVPEFQVWTMLGEHAATRTAVAAANEATLAALAPGDRALRRVEALLTLVADRTAPVTHPRETLHRANLGLLDQPVVRLDDGTSTAVTFPAVRDLFVRPHHRITSMTAQARPADERWWDDLTVGRDLDLALTAHLGSWAATRLPLLLLGHPGAGKSLLTKVLAAHLPAEEYTVVRVPLRSVGANAPITTQIQEALDRSTNGRVSWHELADGSPGTVRVVLLDGLDELLQAARFDRSAYLQEVMDFQRIEAEQQRPAVVVVTSRTVVADRVAIPDGCVMVKLEDFDDEQIAAWLDVWHATNRAAIDSGLVRDLPPADALHQRELAGQPLLLLMLALYAADPAAPRLEPGLSGSELYERIFDNYARREVAKRSPTSLRGQELAARVADQLTRLSVAALAMVNRGAQYLREADLQADLTALGVLPSDPSVQDQGRRLLGEFFFVHAAEAVLVGGAAPGVRQDTERTYEFLHATFGEYLVARVVVETLRDIADAAYGGSRGDRDPDDDLLFAVLSHQALAVRRSTITFLAERFATLGDDERDRVRRTVTVLLESYRRRTRSSVHGHYRPTPVDHARQLAAYSVNLVTLAVAFQEPEVRLPLSLFAENGDEALRIWRSTVSLWRSGLDRDGWIAVLTQLTLEPDHHLTLDTSVPVVQFEGYDELLYAQLRGDRDQVQRVQYGAAIHNRWVRYDGSDWKTAMLSWIIPAASYRSKSWFVAPPPQGTPLDEIDEVVESFLEVLISAPRGVPSDMIPSFEADIPRFRAVVEQDPRVLLALAYLHPLYFVKVDAFHQPDLYFGLQEELRFVLDTVESTIDARHLPAWRSVSFRLLGKGSVEPIDTAEKYGGVERFLSYLTRRRLDG